MDLLDFFRGHLPWSKLGRFLKQLPAGSRYQADIEMDFDVAERRFAEEREAAEKAGDTVESPKLEPSSSAGHDLQVQMLMMIADYIQQLQLTLIGVNLPEGKTLPKPQYIPRPVPAIEVVRARHTAADDDAQVDVALAEMGFAPATPEVTP
ncbi:MULTISPECIES: hypothetical protein [Nocardia]|uniref:hypothetical protein n=1 Tax=Nocardia TaxID=1817 RepID=UPI000D686377|nr:MULTISPECIES: hypothetical protein [Nocardia]